MQSKKIAIIGAGNAACITALAYYEFGQLRSKDVSEIEIYYDPSIPIEQVGQGTTPAVTKLIAGILNNTYCPYKDNYTNGNAVKSTLKSGISYENWGKETGKSFHPFLMANSSNHYVPHLLSKAVLESGLFKVIEKRIDDPEKEIDADIIFDCRGGRDRDKSLYTELINPLNSVILANKEEPDPSLLYTRCVATPNGWTFVIPNIDSVSYGYLYNNTITPKQRAEKNFIELFDVVPKTHINFENYMAKNMFVGERTVLNGNKLTFLEPLEATSSAFYYTVAGVAWNTIWHKTHKDCNRFVQREMQRIQNFVLWHYAKGSKYNTSFWRYAGKMAKGVLSSDPELMDIVVKSRQYDRNHQRSIQMFQRRDTYSQWEIGSIGHWDSII